jgi:hypothetical protein
VTNFQKVVKTKLSLHRAIHLGSADKVMREAVKELTKARPYEEAGYEVYRMENV